LNPEIRFALARKGLDRAVLSIEDNGPGVPAALFETLFTPFVTGRAQGTGLGLSFVRKTVEEHAGEVRYLSQSSGARFDLSFPLAFARARMSPLLAAPEPEPEFGFENFSPEIR
jgi:nitrogen-specific signal transduction histidine kinase